MVKKIICTILLLFFFTALFAEDLEIKSSVDREKASVGEVVKYIVTYAEKKDSTYKVELPEKKVYFPVLSEDDKKQSENKAQSLVPVFEIRNIIKKEEKAGDENIVKYEIEIVYFRTGSYALPQLYILDSEDIAIGYNIPSIEIEKKNVDGQKTPDEPPLELSGNYTRLIILIFGVVILTIVAVLFFIYIRKIMKKRKKPETVIPPIEIFKKDVETLKQKSFIEKNMKADFCFELSHIFKKYLSLSMNADVLEMTNEELAAFIECNVGEFNINDKSALLETYRNISNLWDLSKFAEFDPSEDMLKMNLNGTCELAEKVVWEAGNVRFRI